MSKQKVTAVMMTSIAKILGIGARILTRVYIGILPTGHCRYAFALALSLLLKRKLSSPHVVYRRYRNNQYLFGAKRKLEKRSRKPAADVQHRYLAFST